MATITECQEQVHLISIMSVAEDRLQTNFRAILKRLERHDKVLAEQVQRMNAFEEKNDSYNSQKALEDEDRINNVREKFYMELEKQSNKFVELTLHTQNTVESALKTISHDFNKQKSDLDMEVDEMRQRFQNHIKKLQNTLENTQNDLLKAYEEIYKKEDVNEARKLSKEVDTVKQKNVKFESDSKMLEYKIEKMQILNEKAEKNQIKKEGQLIKDIEDRIKKEVKHLQKGMKHGVEIYSREDLGQDSNSAGKSIHYHQQIGMTHEEQMQQAITAQKNNLERMAVNKLTDKVTLLENKLANMETNVKELADTKKLKKHNEVDQKLKEKMNEIMPEIIKLWAKCDALDDRIVFSDRRSEERNKLVNNLLEVQKQNNWGKMNEKLKIFQTEMYASLKQIKSKIETKVNCVDFEKNSSAMEDKIKQIMEIIYLKSDKMQVKKALLFLESKIKQIILVISEDQQHQKDALLTRKQLKCISCDKDIEKMGKLSTDRGNWDGLPMKDHSPERLGKFGMTNFGLLSKKLKKLENRDLPVLNKKKNIASEKQNA